MIVVGLTGGIGAGKSTIATFFKELNVPVYFADNEAKRLMHTSKVVKEKIINEFGEKAYIHNKLNRPFLAAIVFNDKSKLTAINAIVHPSVSNSFKRWTHKQTSPYVIQENAILFENGTSHKFDYIITVTAPLDEKIQRVMVRDNVKRADVLTRINNQISDSEKIKRSDFVIHNLDLVSSKKEVIKIHKKLLKLAKQ
jgi:dephospho-CoA kinase